jgi:hypothetical protein
MILTTMKDYLRAKLARMTTCTLSAVGGTRRKTCIAFTADFLVAVIRGGQCLEGWLDNSTTQTGQLMSKRRFLNNQSIPKDKVKGGFLLDIVVAQGPSVFKLLAGEDESLLVRWDPFLVLDLGLDIVDGIRGFHLD